MQGQDALWMNRNGIQKPYPDFGVIKPATPIVAPVSERLGPSTLNSLQGNLITRWWACWQDGVNVVVAGADGVTYGDTSIVFVESDVISQLTLTFDQVGRPNIFYKTETNELKLYWFDPILGSNTISVIGSGTSPYAIFDFPTDTNQSFTDVVIFYIGTDTQVKYRKQRDRFEVEYAIPGLFGSSIISAGLTTENRVQVVVR